MNKTKWRPQGFHAKLLKDVIAILADYDEPITLRQLFYQVISRHKEYPNTKGFYDKKFVYNTERARKSGHIPFNAFIDPTRRVIKSSSWVDLPDFISTVKESYKKNKWVNQKKYVEVWIEKDTLLRVFEPITNYYDVKLLSGHGQFSLSSLNEAAKRFPKNKSIYIIYFGDFDPEGKNIPKNAEERLNEFFGVYPKFEILALTKEDIDEWELPPKMVKKGSSLASAFTRKHGKKSAVELDALPPDVLRQKVEDGIKKRLNTKQFDKDLKTEEQEIKELNELIK